MLAKQRSQRLRAPIFGAITSVACALCIASAAFGWSGGPIVVDDLNYNNTDGITTTGSFDWIVSPGFPCIGSAGQFWQHTGTPNRECREPDPYDDKTAKMHSFYQLPIGYRLKGSAFGEQLNEPNYCNPAVQAATFIYKVPFKHGEVDWPAADPVHLGMRGHHFWNFVLAQNDVRYLYTGRWTPNLPCNGLYRVEVYIGFARTANAVYKIHTAEGDFNSYPIKQSKTANEARNEWVPLVQPGHADAFYGFTKGTTGYVELSNLTGEGPPCKVDIEWDACRFTPVCLPVTACKFNDLDMDGVQDAGEPAVQGWPFRLEDEHGLLVSTAVTGPDGCAELCPVTTGNFRLCEDITFNSCGVCVFPADYPYAPLQNTRWLRTTAVTCVNVTIPEDACKTFTFANVQLCPLKVCKFDDWNPANVSDPNNANGVWNTPTEAGIANWPVYICRTAGVALPTWFKTNCFTLAKCGGNQEGKTDVTGADGCVNFYVPPGTYRICEDMTYDSCGVTTSSVLGHYWLGTTGAGMPGVTSPIACYNDIAITGFCPDGAQEFRFGNVCVGEVRACKVDAISGERWQVAGCVITAARTGGSVLPSWAIKPACLPKSCTLIVGATETCCTIAKLPPGIYTVSEASGGACGVPVEPASGQFAIELSECEQENLTFRNQLCVYACKFNDVDMDGVKDPSESVVEGWPFRLETLVGGIVVDQGRTGPDGCVKLCPPGSGTFKVCEDVTFDSCGVYTFPAGYVHVPLRNTKWLRTTSVVCQNIVIPGDEGKSYSFANVQLCPVKVCKFDDWNPSDLSAATNANGVWNAPTEPGIVGWPMYICRTAGVALPTWFKTNCFTLAKCGGNQEGKADVTGTGGCVDFYVPPGTYKVCEDVAYDECGVTTTAVLTKFWLGTTGVGQVGVTSPLACFEGISITGVCAGTTPEYRFGNVCVGTLRVCKLYCAQTPPAPWKRAGCVVSATRTGGSALPSWYNKVPCLPKSCTLAVGTSDTCCNMDKLAPGIYTVSEAVSDNCGTACNPASGQFTGVQFGECGSQTLTFEDQACVYAFKFNDLDMDGVYDEGVDPVVEGWPFVLKSGGSPIASGRTDSNGRLQFCVPKNGTYEICEDMTFDSCGVYTFPADYVHVPLRNTKWLRTQASTCQTIVIPNDENKTFRYGNVRLCPVTVCKFDDWNPTDLSAATNANGVWNTPAEPGIANWPVYICRTAGVTLPTWFKTNCFTLAKCGGNQEGKADITGAGGCVTFYVPPGTYKVCEDVAYDECGVTTTAVLTKYWLGTTGIGTPGVTSPLACFEGISITGVCAGTTPEYRFGNVCVGTLRVCKLYCAQTPPAPWKRAGCVVSATRTGGSALPSWYNKTPCLPKSCILTVGASDTCCNMEKLAPGIYTVAEAASNLCGTPCNPASGQFTGVQFGECASLTLTFENQACVYAFKFNDLDMDGVYDEGVDPVVEGWPFVLKSGGSPIASGRTDATGRVRFCVPKNGTYEICEDMTFDSCGVYTFPADYVHVPLRNTKWLRTQASTCQTILIPGDEENIFRFGNVRLCPVKVCKFDDWNPANLSDPNNANGIWNTPAEPGLANWPVYICRTAGITLPTWFKTNCFTLAKCGGNQEGKADVTGASGCVDFYVPPGTYKVCEDVAYDSCGVTTTAVLTKFWLGTTGVGQVGVASPLACFEGISITGVCAGTTPEYRFGNICLASLEACKINYDTQEPWPLPGCEITATRTGGSTLPSWYSAGGCLSRTCTIVPGEIKSCCSIEKIAPGTWSLCEDTTTTNGCGSPIDPASGCFTGIGVQECQTDITRTFQDRGCNVLRGAKWLDSNVNGIRDNGEPLLDQWRMCLYKKVGPDWVLERCTWTGYQEGSAPPAPPDGDQGVYQFDDVLPGVYKIEEDPAPFESGDIWINTSRPNFEDFPIVMPRDCKNYDFGNVPVGIPRLIFQAYPGTSEEFEFVGFDICDPILGGDPIKGSPGIFALDPGGNGWPYWIPPVVGQTRTFRHVILDKIPALAFPCEGVFPETCIRMEGNPDDWPETVRIWWPVLYETPGTLFLTRVEYNFNGHIGTNFLFVKVFVLPEHLRYVLHVFHQWPFGLDEVGLISDEDLFATLLDLFQKAYEKALSDPGAAINYLNDAAMLIDNACIAESPDIPYPTGDDTGIAETEENPACCKLLVDIEYIIDQLLGVPERYPECEDCPIRPGCP